MKWLEDLSRSLAAEPDEIPKGWLTSEQAAKIRGTCPQVQRRLFAKAVKRGLVQSAKFRVRTPSGKLFLVMHYGPAKTKSH